MKKGKSKLKVFIWDDFLPDWSGGKAVVIASSREEARKILKKSMASHLNKDTEREVEAGPDRVRKLHPLAEFVSGGG